MNGTERTIWEYQLPIAGSCDLYLPLGARILALQMRDGRPCIWVEVCPTRPLGHHRFVTYGTRQSQRLDSDYIGTYQEGSFVWHVYEVGVEVEAEDK